MTLEQQTNRQRCLLVLTTLVMSLLLQWGASQPAIAQTAPVTLPTLNRLAYKATAASQKDLAQIVQMIQAQPFTSESAKIDFVRNWVYENSIHLIDKDHDQYAFRPATVLSMLWQTYSTGAPPPHLSCGPRTWALKIILDQLGIPSRVVMIFTDDNPGISSHTFLEVFDWESADWVVQDPDFNIYYINQRTRQRLSTLQLLLGDLSAIVPVSGAKVGWQENEVEHLKQHYFEALLYMNHLHGKKSVVMVNLDRFDLNKRFAGNDNSTFPEFANKYYKEPVFIDNQGF